jgi:hypothetical protein
MAGNIDNYSCFMPKCCPQSVFIEANGIKAEGPLVAAKWVFILKTI